MFTGLGSYLKTAVFVCEFFIQVGYVADCPFNQYFFRVLH